MSKTHRAKLKLGTRGSALALWQANWTRDALRGRLPELEIELVPIKTSGDRIQDVPLSKAGGKGLFTKEIDEALLGSRIDFAVHSLKDLPFRLPQGAVLAAVPSREDPRDAVVSDGLRLAELPKGARVGTSSLRRQAQLLHRFPDLEVVSLRGNVDTRLRRRDAGELDAVILAAAGLKRLGHAGRITEYLEAGVMLSAIGQGALGLVCREDDPTTRTALSLLDDPETHQAVLAERALMASLGGSCQVPVAGYARRDGDGIVLDGLIASPDGGRLLREQMRGSGEDPAALGFEIGRRLRARGAGAILDAIPTHGT